MRKQETANWPLVAVAGGVAVATYPALAPLVSVGVGVGVMGYGVWKYLKPANNPKHKLDTIFKRCGVYVTDDNGTELYPVVKIDPTKQSKRAMEADIILPLGLTPYDVEKTLPEIEWGFRGEADLYHNNSGLKLKMYFADLPECIEFSEPENGWQELFDQYIIPLYIGESKRGQEVIDLFRQPHILGGGETNGGKTNLIHVISQSLVRNPKVTYAVCDPARADLTYLANYGVEVMSDIWDTVAYINTLYDVMKQRLDILENNGARNWLEYRQKKGNLLQTSDNFLVYLMDELAMFRPWPGIDKEEKKELLRAFYNLTQLGGVGRKCGIHLLLFTQSPKVEVIPGILKDNIPASIGFKCKTDQASISILGHGGAKKLPRTQGRAIYQFDGEREIQIFKLGDLEARKLLEPYKKPYTPLKGRAKPTEIAGLEELEF